MARDTAMISAGGGVRVCVEAIGGRDSPAILLIGGATWSMDWWEEELCRRLADSGRLVVRYDQRDTGRSTHWPPGSPTYTGTDLVADAIAVLDGLGIDRAHVVGFSMGGGIAQRLAREHRNRIETLTLMSTSPIDGGEDLPGPTQQVLATFDSGGDPLNWGDRDAVVDHIVEGERPYAGPGQFNAPHLRALAEQVFDRSDNIESSLTNHFLLADDDPESDRRVRDLVDLPTLVVHGTADPMFPLAHGRALAGMIPGARMLELDDVGHQLPPPSTWQRLLTALQAHTAPQS